MNTKNNRIIYIHEFLFPQEPQKKILRPLGEIEVGATQDEEELIDKLSRADAVLVTRATRLSRRVIEASPHLKVIGKYGVGVENIDIEAASELRIPVLNVPGVNASAVAEFTLGLMLTLTRRIQFAKNYMKTGGWRDSFLLGDELRNSTIGIIGFGDIARYVIRMLTGFNPKKILVFSKSQSNPGDLSLVQFVDLEQLLAEADIVSIHKALTNESHGLIGKNELKAMKPTAYLINISRGGLIQEEALIQAIENNWIAGAALDVFREEPLPVDSPLLYYRNVVTTPHIGGSTMQTRLNVVTKAAQNVADILMEHQPDLRCLVNPEILPNQANEEQLH